jgi:hypothetical protein
MMGSGIAFFGRAAEAGMRWGLGRGDAGERLGMLPLVRDARSLCASLAGAAPAVSLGRLGVARGREPGPFGTMTGGTGADGSPWMGRNISFRCIQA